MDGWVVGGWTDKTNLILNSTQFEVVVKVEVRVELRKNIKIKNKTTTKLLICDLIVSSQDIL